MAAPRPPALELLSAYHVDNLTEAIKNSSRIAAQQLDVQRRQHDLDKQQKQATDKQTVAIEKQTLAIEANTAAVAELLTLLKGTRSDITPSSKPTPKSKPPTR